MFWTIVAISMVLWLLGFKHQQMALGPFADGMTKDFSLGRRGLRDHGLSVSPA